MSTSVLVDARVPSDASVFDEVDLTVYGEPLSSVNCGSLRHTLEQGLFNAASLECVIMCRLLQVSKAVRASFDGLSGAKLDIMITHLCSGVSLNSAQVRGCIRAVERLIRLGFKVPRSQIEQVCHAFYKHDSVSMFLPCNHFQGALEVTEMLASLGLVGETDIAQQLRQQGQNIVELCYHERLPIPVADDWVSHAVERIYSFEDDGLRRAVALDIAKEEQRLLASGVGSDARDVGCPVRWPVTWQQFTPSGYYRDEPCLLWAERPPERGVQFRHQVTSPLIFHHVLHRSLVPPPAGWDHLQEQYFYPFLFVSDD